MVIVSVPPPTLIDRLPPTVTALVAAATAGAVAVATVPTSIVSSPEPPEIDKFLLVVRSATLTVTSPAPRLSVMLPVTPVRVIDPFGGGMAVTGVPSWVPLSCRISVASVEAGDDDVTRGSVAGNQESASLPSPVMERLSLG